MSTINETLEAEFAQYGPDAAPSWGAVVELMDEDTSNTTAANVAPCTQAEYWAEYCRIDGGKLGDVTQW